MVFTCAVCRRQFATFAALQAHSAATGHAPPTAPSRGRRARRGRGATTTAGAPATPLAPRIRAPAIETPRSSETALDAVELAIDNVAVTAYTRRTVTLSGTNPDAAAGLYDVPVPGLAPNAYITRIEIEHETEPGNRNIWAAVISDTTPGASLNQMRAILRVGGIASHETKVIHVAHVVPGPPLQCAPLVPRVLYIAFQCLGGTGTAVGLRLRVKVFVRGGVAQALDHVSLTAV